MRQEFLKMQPSVVYPSFVQPPELTAGQFF